VPRAALPLSDADNRNIDPRCLPPAKLGKTITTPAFPRSSFSLEQQLAQEEQIWNLRERYERFSGWFAPARCGR
jgi:hypothetical protein